MAEFPAGAVVWARFGGDPFWPARIAAEDVTVQLAGDGRCGGVGVLFFGDPLTYALVSPDCIADFEANMQRYGRGDGTAGFRAALEMALGRRGPVDLPLIVRHRRSLDRPKQQERVPTTDCRSP